MSYFPESYDKKQIMTDPTTTVTNTPTSSQQKVGNVPIATDSNEVGDKAHFTQNTSTENQSPNKRTEAQVLATFHDLTQQYGIKNDELLKLLEEITKLNLKQLQNIEPKHLNNIKQAMSIAFTDATENGTLNKTDALKLSGDYYRALGMGYSSVDDYKKEAKKSTEDINARMTRFFDLEKKGIDFDKLTPTEQHEYIHRYFKGYFNEKITNILNEKGEKEYTQEDIEKMSKEELRGLLTKEEFQKIHNIQKRDFVLLLNNTSDEDKEKFFEGHKSLLADNKLPALNSVVHSYKNDKLRAKHIDEHAADIVKNLNTRDMLNNTTSGEDNAQITSLLTQYGGKKALTEVHEEINNSRKEFYANNKEALEQIEEKEKNPDATYTDEEKELIRERDEYYTAVSAGEFIGASQNKNVSEEFKTSHMQTLTSDAKETPIYENILIYIDKHIEKNPSSLSISEDKFAEIMNKSTDGEYSKIVSSTNTSNTAQTKENTAITNKAPNETTNDSTTQQYQTNPIMNNTTEADDIENSSPEKIEQITASTIDNIDKKGVTAKIHNFSLQKGVKILNKLVKSGKIQNSKFEDRIIEKLKSLSPPTILSLFSNSSDSTKIYLYDNGVIKNSTILVNMPIEQQNRLPEEIKERLQEAKQKS